MKLLLINPPYGKCSYKPMKVPPLGLIMLSNSLYYHKITHKILDLGYETFDYSKKIIKKSKANFFGISIFQENCKIAFKLIKLIKKYKPNSKIILGGVFPTLAHKKILTELKEVDYIVLGEGEEAIIDIIKGTKNLTEKGVSYRENGKIYFSNRINRIKEIDKFSSLKQKNEKENYNILLRESEQKTNIIPLIWSRGCNHNCAFCTISKSNIWRHRTKESVIKEIKEKYNPTKENHIIFFDANPLQNPFLFLELIKEIRKYFNLTFSCSARADTIYKNYNIFKNLSKLGCNYIEVGIESFDENTLNYYFKGIYKEQIIFSINLLKENNIGLELDFILFNPYTTKKEIIFNLKNLEELGFKKNLSIDALFSYLKLYLGTKLRKDYEVKEKKQFNYKDVPKIVDLFVNKKTKEIYLNLIKLKPFIKKIYESEVFAENLIKKRDIDSKNVKEFIILNRILKDSFFEGYISIVKKGEKELSNVKKKLDKILKKLKSLETINFP